MNSLDRFAEAALSRLDAEALRRTLVETARSEGIVLTRGGRRLLSFCCNDYLNLSQHPAIIDAAAAALQQYGAGAGASRLVTGNHPLYAALEARLARWKGTEAACVFGSGYLANTGIIPALVGRGDLVLVDRLAHSSLLAGAQLSGATVRRFRHNDMTHLAEILTAERTRFGHVLIATDGVFSMDGDLAPVAALADVAHQFDAWLLTDDAHGIGVVGAGRGSSAAAGGAAAVPLQMGTLSKAIGSYGGYLCASRPVIDLMASRAATLIYSTGLPPASVAASIAALDLIEREPRYAARPLEKAKAFTRLIGLDEALSPIVALRLGDAEKALEASGLLEEEGFFVAAIRPPTVPPGTARLRFTFTAAHPDAEVERLAEVIRRRILPM